MNIYSSLCRPNGSCGEESVIRFLPRLHQPDVQLAELALARLPTARPSSGPRRANSSVTALVRAGSPRSTTACRCARPRAVSSSDAASFRSLPDRRDRKKTDAMMGLAECPPTINNSSAISLTKKKASSNPQLNHKHTSHVRGRERIRAQALQHASCPCRRTWKSASRQCRSPSLQYFGTFHQRAFPKRRKNPNKPWAWRLILAKYFNTSGASLVCSASI
jgi:hypothetical protein